MLEKKLKKLASASEIYPFHMPGHKRVAQEGFPEPYSIDITEIEGFDNLHHAESVIAEEQARSARIYGSRECRYLVGGSTCGILAAISAATTKGGRILVARNCHKSVYNAIYLRELIPEYVYPVDTIYGIQGKVRVADIERKLDHFQDIQAIILTSPTYDGIVSDIRQIADAAHRRGIPLIVDSAHGAHFGFHEAFPENAARLDADIVIESVHKTLPSFTQTAVLFHNSRLVELEKVDRFLDIYETSSPSYILMAGISRCMKILGQESVGRRFQQYHENLMWFYDTTRDLKYLRVLRRDDFGDEVAYDFDEGKLLLDVGSSGVSGQELKERLLMEYGIQTEMASGNYVLAMTSIMDTRDGFERLVYALHRLDGRLGERERLTPVHIYEAQESCMNIDEALDAPQEKRPLEQAEGRVCGTYIYLYPPGIPVLVPGEKITETTIATLETCMQMGLQVEGFLEETEPFINIVK